MRLSRIAFLLALLPLLTIHLSFLWAASLGHVSWCIPYGPDCTSISSVGRRVPETYLFKTGMIAAVVVMVVYWWRMHRQLLWLDQISEVGNGLMLILGLVASLGLLAYVLALGHIGDGYELQRRVGVTLFYGLSYLALLIFADLVSRVPATLTAGHTGPLQGLRWLAALFLGLALLSLVISAFDQSLYHRVDDAFEWGLTLLLCVYLGVTGVWWRVLEKQGGKPGGTGPF